MQSYCLLLINDASQNLGLVLFEDLPIEKCLQFIRELVLQEGVAWGIGYKVGRIAIGDVEDGGPRVDVFVVIP